MENRRSSQRHLKVYSYSYYGCFTEVGSVLSPVYFTISHTQQEPHYGRTQREPQYGHSVHSDESHPIPLRYASPPAYMTLSSDYSETESESESDTDSVYSSDSFSVESDFDYIPEFTAYIRIRRMLNKTVVFTFIWFILTLFVLCPLVLSIYRSSSTIRLR